MDDELRCINEGGKTPCRGPVEWRVTPDRTDGKPFLRCEGHFEERMESVSRTLELTSPVRAPWFDEGAIGEHWEEDE